LKHELSVASDGKAHPASDEGSVQERAATNQQVDPCAELPLLTQRIDVPDRIVSAIRIEIDVTGAELKGIFADEAGEPRVVVPRPVVVEASYAVILTPGELNGFGNAGFVAVTAPNVS